MTRAQRATGLAYSTVHAAQFRLVREDVALLLQKFTRGAVRAADMESRHRHALDPCKTPDNPVRAGRARKRRKAA